MAPTGWLGGSIPSGTSVYKSALFNANNSLGTVTAWTETYASGLQANFIRIWKEQLWEVRELILSSLIVTYHMCVDCAESALTRTLLARVRTYFTSIVFGSMETSRVRCPSLASFVSLSLIYITY